MTMEESQVERDVKALVEQARAALPQRELMAMMPSGPEGAILHLANAITRIVDSSVEANPHVPVFRYRLDRSDEPKFVISFPSVELSADEIWPEGDAPENPTPTDVIEVMRQQEFAHPMSVIAEWLLIESLRVQRAYDDLTSVVWDGS